MRLPMIKLLEASILPYIILTKDGQLLSESNGCFFSIVDNNFSFHCEEAFYKSIKVNGWNITSRGYAVYTIIYDDLFIIFTGMKVKGVSKIQGKNVGVPYFFSEKSQVEQYVTKLLNVSKDIDREKSIAFREYSHESKEILRDIYQKALEIKNGNSLDSYYNELLENIFAFTGILSTKTDIMNFISNTDLSLSLPEKDFCVHKKFSKIMKCLNTKAKCKNINIVTEGSSYKNISGPRGFELIPFLLLENAIKYSPSNNVITLKFEDFDDKIQVRIESMGPLIDSDEKSRIFTKNYRGRHAEVVEKSGQGIGLYTVKEFLSRGFSGTISVEQSSKNPCYLNNTTYLQTTFELNIPIQNNYLY